MNFMTVPTKALAAAPVWLALIAVPFVLSLPGCEGGGAPAPEVAEASGVVLYKGEPLAGFEVMFNPEKGNPGIGATEADGSFVLTTFKRDDGAIPATHTVTVRPRPQMGGAIEGADTVSIPGKYGDKATSPLKLEVKAGEKNEFTIELTD